MEKLYTTDVITLKSYDLNEADKIIVMYSKQKGLIRSVAKGVKRPKNKLGSKLDLLMANNVQLNKGQNMDTICQAQTINNFKTIREDISKLMISSYISEVVANYGMENDPSASEIYNLLYGAMNAINNSQTKTEILISALKFQLKMMYYAGIMPEFNICLGCKTPMDDKNMYFSIEKGGVFCPQCYSKSVAAIELPYKVRDFLVSLFNTDFDSHNDYEKKATEKICVVCFNFLKKYISKNSIHKFKSEKLLESVL